MTRQTLPTADAVAQALQDLTQKASVTGRRVSISGLARHLGLPNTTLRRHYPDLVDQVSAAAPPDHPRRNSLTDELRQTAHRLRNENRDLRTHLDIAIAHIQRLTIEHDHLRRQADAAGQISRIPKDR